MRRAWIGVLCCIGALTACSDQAPKLSNEEVELIEAVLFALEAIENNTQEKYRLMPWQRRIMGRTIEYSTFGKNSLSFSDAEMNAKTRNSSFIRYIRKISSPETCVFRLESRTEFSNGDSDKDFTGYAMGGAHTFHLLNAYRFDMELEYLGVWVNLEGPAVYCDSDGSCQNMWGKLTPADTDWKPDVKPLSMVRRERAIDLIKKACPGKPY